MGAETVKTNQETGLERVREILFGEILVELERRLGKLETFIAARSNDVQHDSRQRIDVLESHLKKEIEAVATRSARDSGSATDDLRQARHEQHDAITQIEQRIARAEERLEAQIARVEREAREQLLANAKRFFEDLVQLRTQLSMTAARELEDELVSEQVQQGGAEHGALGSH
jgi:hypothetical protein